ncbi:MAG: ATP synthase subunit c [Candidatus Omnitrophica bacterium ADurb.Bin292]|jgi:F-type H+-transporting ATPase subunit c|nr:MAG: ATP synthase subunit c [Candidatus Omnitrophica bacterium ADurb.Bin292]HOG24007.1 ATP synthase F0 subunit C [Candidatus Omnitrophota bacterium]HPW76843.1 ATP synthase F0 subunit C [Candidatus Omnitrophota bacterium]HQB11879.1 ATP synthase F0 subunit C [Candidatus Omnitrophota bacterium]
MTPETALGLSLPLGLAITAFSSAIALGKAVAAAMDATGRQPEASGKILVNMMAGCALIEALTLYSLVFGFVLMGKI